MTQDSSEQMPEDWAIERALRRSGYTATRPAEVLNGSMIYAKDAILAFARHIAQHEQPPVDAIRQAARNLCDFFWPGGGALDGSMDDEVWFERVEIALRRGIELAQERQP